MDGWEAFFIGGRERTEEKGKRKEERGGCVVEV